MVIKSTRYVGKKTLYTVPGELIPCAVDGTVSIHATLYKVAQITDIITEEPHIIKITREVKVVEKLYY